MHISEGVLSGPVLVSGMAFATAGVAVGLKKLDYNRIPQTGILAAAFFIASLIHIPIGPSSVHLILNGILGLLLGWSAFPAIMVALILQAVFFQFGGITTLGINTLIMALPAVLCYFLFRNMINGKHSIAFIAAFSCGFISVFFGAVLVGLVLIFTKEDFIKVATLTVAVHFPVMLIEGIITAFCVAFLRRVQPAILYSYSE